MPDPRRGIPRRFGITDPDEVEVLREGDPNVDDVEDMGAILEAEEQERRDAERRAITARESNE